MQERRELYLVTVFLCTKNIAWVRFRRTKEKERKKARQIICLKYEKLLGPICHR